MTAAENSSQSLWLQEPGATALALKPYNKDVLKTLPTADTATLQGELPSLENEISEKCTTYLQTRSGLIGDRWMAVMMAPVAFFMTPAAIGIGIYGVFEADMGMAIGFIALAFAAFGLWPARHVFSMLFLCYEDEPIRFNRLDRKVYWFRSPRRHLPGIGPIPAFGKAEVKIYDWQNLRGEIVRKLIFTGKTARRDSFLELAHVDPSTGLVTERFRVGDRDAFGDFSGRVALWETLRRYMEIGPEAVPDAALHVDHGTLLDCLDEFNPLTLARKLAPGAARAIGYFLTLVALPVAPMFLAAGLAKWIANLTARKVDWGELENTVFKLSPDDPSLKRSLDPAIARPDEWAAELKQRRIMTTVWVGFVLAEIAFALWWFS